MALADKLDTLTGFWAIDEKPTGSKDPYALRRAALGVVRMLLERKVNLRLTAIATAAAEEVFDHIHNFDEDEDFKAAMRLDQAGDTEALDRVMDRTYAERPDAAPVIADLLSFFHDRLKVYLRDLGARHDLIDAVLAVGDGNDDLLMVARRVEALTAFVTGEEGLNLLAGTKRATQLLAAEEKKGTEIGDSVDATLLTLPAETELYVATTQAAAKAAEAVGRDDFRAAMEALAVLRGPIDTFFADVLVNDENPAIRANRLALLARIRAATGTVADFSKIAG